MKKEDLEKFKRQREHELAMRVALEERCNAIKASYYAGALISLAPLWHLDKADIDLQLQPEKLDEIYLADGYSILPDVDIESVLRIMQQGNSELFKEKILFHDELSHSKICGVIYNWQSGIKLIPPTIILNRMLKDKIYPADGKHRINVAYVFGAKSLPLLVPNVHLSEVSSLLGM